MASALHPPLRRSSSTGTTRAPAPRRVLSSASRPFGHTSPPRTRSRLLAQPDTPGSTARSGSDTLPPFEALQPGRQDEPEAPLTACDGAHESPQPRHGLTRQALSASGTVAHTPLARCSAAQSGSPFSSRSAFRPFHDPSSPHTRSRLSAQPATSNTPNSVARSGSPFSSRSVRSNCGASSPAPSRRPRLEQRLPLDNDVILRGKAVVVSDMAERWRHGEAGDLELRCDGATPSANPVSLRCHASVLAAASPTMEDRIRYSPRSRPMVLKGVRWLEAQAALEFLYTGEARVGPESLLMLLQAANR